MSDSIGKVYIDIQARADKIKSDFDSIRSDVSNRAREIEDRFAKIKLDVDSRAIYMKISELKQYSADLSNKLQQQIKMNVDYGDIEKTKVELDQVNQKLQGFIERTNEGASSATSFFSKLGLAMAEVFAIKKISDFVTESISLAAELQDLQKAFKGSTEDLELFKKATAGTVDDGDLYKLSNLALALGISIKDQPKLFLLATNAVRDYGGTIQEKFEGIIRATEGMVRGIGQLGIERGAFNQKVKELAAIEGDSITNLDAEIQKRIRLQAIMELSGNTIEDVKNRQATLNEKIKSLPILVTEAKEAFGTMLISVVSKWQPLLDVLNETIRKMKIIAAGGSDENAAKNSMSPAVKNAFFGGTSKEDRDSLIKQWEKDKTDLEKSMQQGTAYTTEQYKNGEAKTLYDASIATIKERIKIAKELGDKFIEVNAFTPKDESIRTGDNSGESEKEKVSMAIEDLKFAYADYYKYKIDLINKEAAARIKDGQDAIAVETAKYNKLRELAKEYIDYVDKEFKPYGFTGDAKIEMKTPQQLVASVPDKLPIGKDPGNKDSIRETSAQLKAQLVLTGALKSGFDNAGNGLADAMGKAVQVFGQANSLLEKFINDLGEAVVKSLALSAVNWATGGILGMLGIGAHDGGSFVGTPSGVMRMAAGGSFIVPPGYDRDSFPLMVESGERVSVIPANQVNNNFNNNIDMSGIAKQLAIINANLVSSSGREVKGNIGITGKLEGSDIMLSNRKAMRTYNRYTGG